MWSISEQDIINGADFNLIVSGADPDRIKSEKIQSYKYFLESASLRLFDDERLFHEALYINYLLLKKFLIRFPAP